MKRLNFIILLLWLSLDLSGQDIHLTQFYSNPMFVNSANTGNFNGDYRAGLNARSQWASVAEPYQTVAVHTDFGIVPDGSNSENWIGLGASFSIDSEGGGILQTINAHGHIAFHKHLSSNSYLSVGAGFGYINKSVDLSRITFGAQWNGTEFDGTIPSMESFQNEQIGFFDVRSGISYTYFVERTIRFTTGFAVQHINEPSESFFFVDNTRESGKRSVRPTVHIGSDIFLDQVVVMPAAYYTTTKKTDELVLGTNLSYDLDGTAIIGGIWYRSTGTGALLAGVQLDQNRILVSYDLDVGQVKEISGGNNGIELSIMRVGGIRKSKSKMYCPRF